MERWRQTVTKQTANEFLAALSPRNSLWSGPANTWIFRGQKDASWGLVPSVFREDVATSYAHPGVKGMAQDVVEQIWREMDLLHDFALEASSAGVRVPGDNYAFRRAAEIRGLYPTNGWPDQDSMELFAMAQHSGVPTRLLDFTERALVAAFFAALDAWQASKAPGKRPVKELSVWALNRRFIDTCMNALDYEVRAVRVSTLDNDYMRAQRALFVYDAGLGHRWTNTPPTVDLAKRIDEVYEQVSDKWKGDTKPVVQLRLPTAQAGDLLKMLDSEGIAESTLMPSQRSVVETLKRRLRLRIPRYHPGSRNG